MNPKVCSLRPCGRDYYAKDFCEMHYARWRRYGDPLMTKLPRRSFKAVWFTDCGDGCYEWDETEYPRKRINGHTESLCRLVLRQKLGRELRRNHGALHTCDNPKCINGRHLYEGTQQDNINDMVQRGRSANPKGSKPPWTKLTTAKVEAIRSLLAENIPYRHVAKQFNMSPGAIHHIKMGRSWSN